MAAIRELIEEALRAPCGDAATARTLRLALEALDVLWGALEGEEEAGARQVRERADFFEFAPDACVVTDVNGTVRCANPAAAELLGLSAAELIHRPLASFLAPQQQALAPAYLLEMIAHGKEPRAMRWRSAVGGPDGAVPVEVSVREMGRAGGRITGLCWLVRPLSSTQPAVLASAAAPKRELPALPQTPR